MDEKIKRLKAMFPWLFDNGTYGEIMIGLAQGKTLYGFTLEVILKMASDQHPLCDLIKANDTIKRQHDSRSAIALEHCEWI